MQNLTYGTNELIYETETRGYRNQTCCQGGGGRGRAGAGDGLADGSYYIYRMDKHQGPTLQHRELHSISCDKLWWKRISKKLCIHITESLYCTAEVNIVNQLYINKNIQSAPRHCQMSSEWQNAATENHWVRHMESRDGQQSSVKYIDEDSLYLSPNCPLCPPSKAGGPPTAWPRPCHKPSLGEGRGQDWSRAGGWWLPVRGGEVHC